MSDNQTVWMILWKRALTSDDPRAPFEIAEVVPQVVAALHVQEEQAVKLVGGLLTELARLPEGKRFFRREGNAVVPLPEFARVPRDPGSELSAYPYEL
jgi:hypothetical protein